MLLVSVVLWPHLMKDPLRWSAVACESLFVQNYLGVQWGVMWNHTWSLAIEEHFYVGLPLVLLGLLTLDRARPVPSPPSAGERARVRGLELRNAECGMRISETTLLGPSLNPQSAIHNPQSTEDPFRGIVPICALAIVGLTAWRCWLGTRTDWDFLGNLTPTHLRIDALLAGVWLSYLANFRGEAFQRFVTAHARKLKLCGMLLLAPAFVLVVDRTVWLTTYGLTLIYVGGACLLCGVLGRPPKTTTLVRGLATVGYYSYSVYLWHMPVKDWFAPLFRIGLGIPKTYLTEAATYFTLSIVGGIVLAKLVEFPMLKLRDRWFPSPTALPVPEPVAPTPAVQAAAGAPV